MPKNRGIIAGVAVVERMSTDVPILKQIIPISDEVVESVFGIIPDPDDWGP